MNKLAPCPFCNRELVHDEKIEATMHPKVPYDEYCPLARFLFASDRTDIINAWNKRSGVAQGTLSPDDDWEERGAADELRAFVIEECAHAAFEAYGSITSSQYVLEGPAGLAKRMINAIKALSAVTSTECPLCPGFSAPCGNTNCPQLQQPTDGGGK